MLIDDLDRTLEHLLRSDPLVADARIHVAFEPPIRKWSDQVAQPTINLYLYDVRENPHLRAQQHEPVTRARNGDPLDPRQIYYKRTPLRIDCFYMITVWMPGRNPQDEHSVLSRCLLALARHPVLPEDELQGALQRPTFEIRTRLAPHDVLTNPAEVWSVLDNDIRPSIPYVVTLALDPWQPEGQGEPVRTLSFTAGVEERPEELARRPLRPQTRSTTLRIIGGTIRSRAREGAPAPHVEVSIEGTGLYTRTDEQGRFRLRGLEPGRYTLVAQVAGAEVGRTTIQNPAGKEEYYDLEIE